MMPPALIAFAVILAIAVAGYVLEPGLVGDLLASKLSAQQIAQVAANAGFSGDDLQTAVAIALAESGGNPAIIGDKTLAPTNGPSIGLWQINTGTKAHPEYASDDPTTNSLIDPQNNANAAFGIYAAAGGGFRDWATFDPRNGTTPRYLAFLQTAASGVAGVSA